MKNEKILSSVKMDLGFEISAELGFEISAEYCDIAEKRIASVGKDIPLFEAD